MRDVRDMEAEAARAAALSPEDRAREGATLRAHRIALGLEDGPLAEIAAERARQVLEEGWTPQHDDLHDAGQMAIAAAGYAAFSAESDGFRRSFRDTTMPESWPWLAKWWKPTTRRQDLVKAAALIVAEIERLDRAEASK